MCNNKHKRLLILSITLLISVMSPISAIANEEKQPVKGYEPQRRAWFMTEQGRNLSNQDRVRKGLVDPKDITSDYFRKEYTKPDEKGEVIFNSEPFENNNSKVYEPIEKIEIPEEENNKDLDLNNDALDNLNSKKEKAPVVKKEKISQEKIKDTGLPTYAVVLLGTAVIVVLVVAYLYINSKKTKEDEDKEKFKEETLEESFNEIDKEEHNENLGKFNYDNYLDNSSINEEGYHNDCNDYKNSDLNE